MMEVYLDNSATTQVDEEVRELVLKIMASDYGNAASLHQKGVEAEKYIREAKERIAKTLKCEPKNIYFTSGGTESNNWAINGTARANRRAGMHLITTSIEHPSVKNAMEALKDQGFETTYLPVDRNGIVSLDELEKAMRPDTILVSVMMVNNEIGAVEPIQEIGEFLSRNYPKTLFHVDAIQAYGKLEINVKKMHIDLLSASGHKLHGPKGVGFLYVSDRVKIHPLIYGGGQQRGMRSGTENVPGEAGIGLAAEKLYKNLEEHRTRLYELKQRFAEGIQKIEGAHINGKYDKESAPHILSVSFAGVRSEVLLHALEDKGVYVSSGSACSSSHPSEINTLMGIGLSREEQEGTIRFSFSIHTTKEEIDYTLEKLNELLPVLRRYTRR